MGYKEFSGRLIAAILGELQNADKKGGSEERLLGYVEGLYRAEMLALSILADMERKGEDDAEG